MLRKSVLAMSVLLAAVMSLSGCAVNFYRQHPRSQEKIDALQEKVQDLEAKRRAEQARFEEVKAMLERRLESQISKDQVSLEVQDRGLVIVLSDDILFDSGRATVKEDAHNVLDNLTRIAREELRQKDIGIAGHTDNVPITHSHWASNWELSTARATSVLHYFLDAGVSPERLSATGYGEHRPVASNATPEGRAKNRRVEIVILPEFVEKRPEDISAVIK